MKRKIATILKQPWLYIICAELLLIFVLNPLEFSPGILYTFLPEPWYDIWEIFAVSYMGKCISLVSLFLFLLSGALALCYLIQIRRKAGLFVLYTFLAFFAIGLTMPTIGRAREEAKRISCHNNLKQIYCALAIYAADYNSNLPPDLKTLYVANYLTYEAIYRCPSRCRPNKEFSDYIYYRAERKLDEKNPFVLIADHEKNHSGKYCNVIMSDGKLLKTRNKPGK
jgi:hypothetical protein